MRADVHLQRAQRDVHLVAVLAAKRLLRLVALSGWAVELLVLRQTAERGVGLGAVRARVPRNVSMSRRLFCALLSHLRFVLDVR